MLRFWLLGAIVLLGGALLFYNRFVYSEPMFGPRAAFADQMAALDRDADYVGMERAARLHQKSDPSDPNIFFTLGRSQFYRGNFAGAIQNWNTALQMEPKLKANSKEWLATAARLQKRYPNLKLGPIRAVPSEIEVAKTQDLARGAALLESQNWDKLEAVLESETQKPTILADGSWRVMNLAVGILRGSSDSLEEESWHHHHTLIEAWNGARPTSQFAPSLLARSWVNGAWAARGEKAANRVTDIGWQDMETRLAKAAPLFAQIGAQKAPPLFYYSGLQRFDQLSGAPKTTVKAHADAAIARFPTYTNFYEQQLYNLLPRWGGDPGEWERVLTERADREAKRAGRAAGDALYARLAWHIRLEYERDALKNLDTRRILRGFDEILRQFPRSVAAASFAFHVAWEIEDGKTMRRLMQTHLQKDVDKRFFPTASEFSRGRIAALDLP